MVRRISGNYKEFIRMFKIIKIMKKWLFFLLYQRLKKEMIFATLWVYV